MADEFSDKGAAELAGVLGYEGAVAPGRRVLSAVAECDSVGGDCGGRDDAGEWVHAGAAREQLAALSARDVPGGEGVRQEGGPGAIRHERSGRPGTEAVRVCFLQREYAALFAGEGRWVTAVDSG